MKLLLLIGSLAAAASLGAAETKPNVLVFYLDDMGWAQPGCYGGNLVATPNIDALARDGVRFTHGYVSACVCAPSRVGLLTGRYQARSGHDANTTARAGTGLVLSETLMSQHLKAAGYATAICGKWHLGHEAGYLPAARGFDFSMGSVSNLGEGRGPSFYRGSELLEDLPGAPVTSPVYAREAHHLHRESAGTAFLPLFALQCRPHAACRLGRMAEEGGVHRRQTRARLCRQSG
jgi:arylsulfatase A-like enzyme